MVLGLVRGNRRCFLKHPEVLLKVHVIDQVEPSVLCFNRKYNFHLSVLLLTFYVFLFLWEVLKVREKSIS